MKIEKLLAGLEYKFTGESFKVSGLSYDSRQVQQGDLFVAIRGFKTDGHNYILQAQQRGAVGVLVENIVADINLPQVVVSNTRAALSVVSRNFYGDPGKHLNILGVTGTNGKTTTTYLLKAILEKAGYKVGLIGTIQVLIGDLTLESQHTTPESLDLQRILAQMVEEKVEYVIMEVSSHALQLQRTAGMDFAGVLFTNLSQDHLDFHSSLEDYFLTKARLFQGQKGPAAINYDDPWGRRLERLGSGEMITYGIDKHAQVRASKIELEKDGVSYILNSGAGQIPIELNLTGYFNVYNSLSAATLCLGLGIPIESIKNGLEAVAKVPGRFERITNDIGLNIIIDYAHTPDGLENILKTARELTKHGEIILVFGAGGDRDKAKRPLMGQVAARLADQVVITSDNPRSEDPREICSSIESGLLTVNPQARYGIILDRREAIKEAISLASGDDLVVIAGKGHETYQEFASGRIHFDDGEEVIRAIKELTD